MFSTTDDDDLFTPAQSSNLAALFGKSLTVADGSNTSLSYTAPKQPKPISESPKEPTKSKPQSSVFCAKLIHLHKLVEKSYISQGKYGLAVIGNDTVKDYDLIIYIDKQNIITRNKITVSFNFFQQQNNFASFYDDKKQNWLIRFENVDDYNGFSKEVERCGGKIVKNVQETTKPSIPEAKPELHVKPSSLPLITKNSEPEADTQSDSSETQTKADILTRMAKMGQPILPVPLPKKSTDLSESETDEGKISKRPVRKPKRTNHSAKDSNVSPMQDKIISEEMVSKYSPTNGQYIPTNECQPSFIASAYQPQPFIPMQSMNQNVVSSSSQFQITPTVPNHLLYNQIGAMSQISDPFNLLIAENRTHNCEIRMNLLQLTSKVDQILDKVGRSDAASLVPSEEGILKSKIHLLEHTVSKLTQDIASRDKTINELSEIVSSLQEQLQNKKAPCDDQLNILLRQENEQQKAKIHELESSVNEYEQQTKELKIRLKNLEALKVANDVTQDTNDNLKITVENQAKRIEELEKMITENNQDETVNKLNNELTDLQIKLKKSEQYCESNEAAQLKRNETNNLKVNQFSDKLKDSMNFMYQEILGNFQDESVAFQTTQIRKILAPNIKAATFKIVKEFNSDFSSDEVGEFNTSATAEQLSAPDIPHFDDGIN